MNEQRPQHPNLDPATSSGLSGQESARKTLGGRLVDLWNDSKGLSRIFLFCLLLSYCLVVTLFEWGGPTNYLLFYTVSDDESYFKKSIRMSVDSGFWIIYNVVGTLAAPLIISLIFYVILRCRHRPLTLSEALRSLPSSEIIAIIATLLTSYFGTSYLLARYDLFSLWTMWHEPQCYRGCTSRVDAHQAPLFTPQIYASQFRWVSSMNMSIASQGASFNESFFTNIQSNQTLCKKGFSGNSDLYGLGIRTGIYVQWFASLVANNLLSDTAGELRKVYLIFSLAMCIATFVSTFQSTCVFAVEIEVIHWMFWGGSVCVFISTPDLAKFRPTKTWMKLSWVLVIQFYTNMLMTYHGLWFILYAYDHVFTKMPCGTHQFFIVRTIDPSRSFWTIRTVLTTLVFTLSMPLLFTYPLTIIVFASEAAYSIREGAVFQMLFPQKDSLHSLGAQQTNSPQALELSITARTYKRFRSMYSRVREHFGLPAHAQPGIRLITPADLKHRRYVYRLYVPAGRTDH